MTQHNRHFPLQGCISFIAYNGIPLNLSMMCLETFATVPSLSTKALWSPPKGSDRAGLLWKSWAHFIHSGVFMKNYLLRKTFLYKLT